MNIKADHYTHCDRLICHDVRVMQTHSLSPAGYIAKIEDEVNLHEHATHEPASSMDFQSQSQSQRYLLQQDKYHTYNNIKGWNPFGFICLMNDQHSSYRKWPHFGDNNVSTSVSTRAERSLKGTAQPPQAALRVFMLKTSSAASDSKADPTMTTPLQWITKMPNIQCENTREYT